MQVVGIHKTPSPISPFRSHRSSSQDLLPLHPHPSNYFRPPPHAPTRLFPHDQIPSFFFFSFFTLDSCWARFVSANRTRSRNSKLAVQCIRDSAVFTSIARFVVQVGVWRGGTFLSGGSFQYRFLSSLCGPKKKKTRGGGGGERKKKKKGDS